MDPDYSAFNSQSAYSIRCEWGLNGVELLSRETDVLVIVDVLSFTTSIDLITSNGAVAYPYKYRDGSVQAYAESVGAQVGSEKNPDGFSLSPRTLEKVPAGYKMVLPSPNGSTLSLATGTRITFAGCLRNAKAVATAAAKAGDTIAVIPSGERWEDESLRPALEDQLGAGAILSYLEGEMSSEARAAKDLFTMYCDDLESVLRRCSSGKEKIIHERDRDIELAAALNVSQAVPKLVEGAYINVSDNC